MADHVVPHPVSRLEAHTKEIYDPKNDITSIKETISSMKNEVDKLKSQVVDKIDPTVIQDSVSSMKNDVEKLKSQVVDKVPKAVLAELESKLNTHSKSIESFSKKLYELQNNLNAFTQQPVTQIMIETIRRQLTEEIMANVTSMFNEHVAKTNASVEAKHDELKSILQNTKRFVFHR